MRIEILFMLLLFQFSAFSQGKKYKLKICYCQEEISKKIKSDLVSITTETELQRYFIFNRRLFAKVDGIVILDNQKNVFGWKNEKLKDYSFFNSKGTEGFFGEETIEENEFQNRLNELLKNFKDDKTICKKTLEGLIKFTLDEKGNRKTFEISNKGINWFKIGINEANKNKIKVIECNN